MNKGTGSQTRQQDFKASKLGSKTCRDINGQLFIEVYHGSYQHFSATQSMPKT
jgi:hypothetical protein